MRSSAAGKSRPTRASARSACGSLNSGFAFDYDIDASNYTLNARNEMKFGSASNVLVVGTAHDRWTRDVLGAFGSTSNQASHAWYAKDDVTLAGGTRLAAGVRTERIEKDTTSSATGVADRMKGWELGVSHPFTQAITRLRARRPQLPAGERRRVQLHVARRGIAPAGVARHGAGRALGLRSGKAEARVYRSNIDGEIGFDPAAANLFFSGANVNFDPTRRQGLEIDASHGITTHGRRCVSTQRCGRRRSAPVRIRTRRAAGAAPDARGAG